VYSFGYLLELVENKIFERKFQQHGNLAPKKKGQTGIAWAPAA
jgi:hypothetical protein